MSRIELIGIDSPLLNDRQRQLLQTCSLIVVSRRHRPLVADMGIPLLDITPLDAMIASVTKQLAQGKVAILASGDPLFYGIGRKVLDHFGKNMVCIHPALSAVQLACARFAVAWDDIRIVSLHGRQGHEIAGRILGSPRTLLFTDHINSPDFVAKHLLMLLTHYQDRQRLAAIRIEVAENLGLADEKLTSGTLEEIAAQKFSPLNMMLVSQPEAVQHTSFGLTEPEIAHSRGLITKDEIRAVSLHKLSLPKRGVLWDIGGGSGSISLEAARINPELTVFTVEKKPEEQDNIRANIRHYGTYSVHLVCQEAPGALHDLPDPDRVFIGGSGSRLEEIITHVLPRLREGGRILINAVLDQTRTTAINCLERSGLHIQSSTLAVTRYTHPDRTPTVLNPITLILGKK